MASFTAALVQYLDLLERWNSTYNLTSVRDRSGMLHQHLADCLAVLPPLTRHLGSIPNGQCAQLLDVGSGGGLPACVLAIMLPRLQVSCVDTVGKKAAFVRQVVGSLGLANLKVLHARVENLRAGPFDVITARAFSSLIDFTTLTGHLLEAGGAWMAMKGKTPHDEQAALPASLQVFHVEPLAVPGLHAERCLVWIRHRQGLVST